MHQKLDNSLVNVSHTGFMHLACWQLTCNGGMPATYLQLIGDPHTTCLQPTCKQAGFHVSCSGSKLVQRFHKLSRRLAMLSTRCVRLPTSLAAAMKLAQKLSRPCSWSRRLALQLRTCLDVPGPTYMIPGAQSYTSYTVGTITGFYILLVLELSLTLLFAQSSTGCTRAWHRLHSHICFYNTSRTSVLLSWGFGLYKMCVCAAHRTCNPV